MEKILEKESDFNKIIRDLRFLKIYNFINGFDKKMLLKVKNFKYNLINAETMTHSDGGFFSYSTDNLEIQNGSKIISNSA